ncbi:hypothetical protein ACB092_04G066700 [Castanea dentata]
MPAPDQRVGSTFIWLITVLLFISIAVGGGCLILYMIQPDAPYSSWLPFAGAALVAFPWLFWVFTCCYRCMSRRFGFRSSITGGGSGGGGGGGGSNVVNAAGNVAIEAGSVDPIVRSPESDARRRAQFEAILALDDDDDHGSEERKPKKRSSSSSNEMSVASHESEMPLASSMAA